MPPAGRPGPPVPGAAKITQGAVLDWMQTLSVVVEKKVRP